MNCRQTSSQYTDRTRHALKINYFHSRHLSLIKPIVIERQPCADYTAAISAGWPDKINPITNLTTNWRVYLANIAKLVTQKKYTWVSGQHQTLLRYVSLLTSVVPDVNRLSPRILATLVCELIQYTNQGMLFPFVRSLHKDEVLTLNPVSLVYRQMIVAREDTAVI